MSFGVLWGAAGHDYRYDDGHYDSREANKDERLAFCLFMVPVVSGAHVCVCLSGYV